MLAQFIANGIVTGCVYAIVALGFGLIYNTTRVFHFAHGAVYTASAYILFTLYIVCHMNIFLSVVIAVLFGAIVGILIETFVYFPLYRRKAPLSIALISALGVYIFLVNLIAMIYGNETKVLRPGVEKTYIFGNVILTRIQVLEIFVFIALFAMFYLFMHKSKVGKAIRALSNNPELSTVIGIDTKKIRILVFGIGSALAGVASSLIALDVGIDPNIGMSAILTSAVAVIISGIGISEAPVVGAFLLGITQNLVTWQISARWEEAVTFIILIGFLLARPQGILGIRRRIEEL